MNSKEVTKEINSKIRPVLKENGFSRNSGRTYWRYCEDRIDIINFQSFNGYHSEVMGCTTFSYSINLSIFLNFIPEKDKMKEKNGLKRPHEANGHFRRQLKKSIVQPELSIDTVWAVDDLGNNLSECINDSKKQIMNLGFDWYERFNSKEKILHILLNDEVDMENTWGFGNFDSASRNELIAYTAIELNQTKLAQKKLNELLKFYKSQLEYWGSDDYQESINNTKLELERIKKQTICPLVNQRKREK